MNDPSQSNAHANNTSDNQGDHKHACAEKDEIGEILHSSCSREVFVELRNITR